MLLKKLVVASLLISSSAIAAPFGVSWNDPLSKYGEVDKGEIDSIFLKELPKKHTLFSSYLLAGNDKYGLTKVIALGNEIEDDVYGFEGMKQYKSLVESLKSAGYKETYRNEATGQKLYDEADEFWQCLKYQGCGAYMWIGEKTGGETICVELEGSARGQGNLKLTAEGPEWAVMLDAIKESRKQSNDAAF